MCLLPETLFRLWPEAKKLKQKQLAGKIDFSPETRAYIETLQRSRVEPLLEGVIAKLKRREDEKDEKEKQQPWYIKWKDDPEN